MLLIMSTPTRDRAAHMGPERRRPMVLDAALTIAVEQGISAITIGAVAEHLGVTRPVVYACFDDRVILIESLLEREHAEAAGAVLDALHSARGDGPQTAFTDGYRALLRAVADRPQAFQLVFLASPDIKVTDRFTKARADIAAEATRWIRPALIRWWDIEELDRKLPVLIELFMSSCEAAVRSLLNPDTGWSSDNLADLYGRVISQAMQAA